jgi:TolB-like protein/Tfp pilus assembly protein PilF
LAAVDHPNIVTIYSVEEDSGVHFITMQLVEGQRLAEIIPRGGMSTDRFLGIAVPLAKGLAAAHERGVIHRDLKPGNVMVTHEDRVKILDFGLAKPGSDTARIHDTEMPTQPMTQEGRLVGSVPYMSPEQIEAKPVDHRSDIFSLGIVLYELATGRRPFKGASALSVVSSIINDTPEPIDATSRELPPEVESVIGRCLEKDPDRRFQSAVDLCSELEGLRGDKTAPIPTLPREISDGRRSQSSPRRAALYALIAVIALGALLHLFRREISGPQIRDKSVAVIPFENLDPEAESDYFSDGITEDILTQLGTIGDLKVVPSVATKKYKEGYESPDEIGDKLRVATLLTGSVRREGSRLRITCRLVDTATAEQIWAETYDREAADIFAIQDEIARQIVARLEAELSPSEQERFDHRPTASLTAYDYYLKGRELYYQYEKQRNSQAIDMFKRAIEIDPSFAPAHAGLADAYSQLALRYGGPFSSIDEATRSAEMAITLDPGSAEGYKALGLSYILRGNYRRGVEEYRKAIDLNPNYFSAVGNAGAIYLYLGMLDEAVSLLERSAALNPIHTNTYKNLGDAYRLLGDFDKAEEVLTTVAEGGYTLALVYVAKGEHDLALEQIPHILGSDPEGALALERAGEIAHYVGDTVTAKRYYQESFENHEDIESHPYAQAPIGLGYMLLEEGHVERGEALLDLSAGIRQRRIDEGNDEFYPRYDLALINAIRGNHDASRRWLREAVEAGWLDYRLAQKDPWFQGLHDDAEFREILNDVSRRVAAMRARVLSEET